MTLADGALRAGYRLNRFDTLASTNDEAMRRATAGDPGRLWVVADAQSAGRGRHGRSWASPRGNLYASLLVVDAIDPAIAWQLGFVASVALADAVGDLLGDPRRVAIKWPNDLLLGEAKVAGVLVEGTRLRDGRFAAVLGFGVNCASSPDGTPYPATCLAAVAAGAPSAAHVFTALSGRLPEALALWDLGRGFAEVRTAWLERALEPGTRMTVSARDGRQAGSFETIDAQGRLLLATPEGRRTIDMGEIQIVDVPAPAG